ncbi:MAG: carboxypeptidase-like regulatory domain-containing protein [Bacteroidota bacterium]
MNVIRFVQRWSLLVAVLILASCQREIVLPGGDITPGDGVNDNITVVAGVRGTVIDEAGRPVSGALVTCGVQTQSTDRYGNFSFKNISLSKANGSVKVVKSGYFTHYRSFLTTAGRMHQVRIQLLPKSTCGTFDAASGGTVNLSNGAKLVMPANAVADASGNAYSGQVQVAMTWIDPSANNLSETVMGDLRGIITAGEERGLETFGMIGVELTSPSGKPLNVAAGKKADLSFPIPASLSGTAPATIDLWYFNESRARWIQEGSATRSGNNYQAQVSHFSFWNCDAPFPLIDLCMTLQSATGNQPLNNVAVRIRRPNNSYGYGRTDSTGRLCGKVPKNEALTLMVLDQCGNTVYTQAVGPFSANTDLGVIQVAIPAANVLTISGTLTDCNNNPVTSGSVLIYTGGAYSYHAIVTNGTFSHTILRCSGGTLNFSLLGIDFNTLQQGVVYSGTGTVGNVNVGTIQACGTSATEFIELIVDGTPYNFVSPPDQVNISDSAIAPPFNAWVNGVRTNQGGGSTFTTAVNFNFNHNGVVATGLSLQNASVYLSPSMNSQQIVTANPTMNLTAYGAPATGFAEGNFNVLMNFGGTNRTVVCTFKVRR